MSRNTCKSRGGGKHSSSHGGNTVVHSSIQFDSSKLFCENLNRPTAAKSAGTVGKWGITSFTSIRSAKISLGAKESKFSSFKKKRLAAAVLESKRLNGKCAQSESLNSSLLAPSLNQPRKFFKSSRSGLQSDLKSRVNSYGRKPQNNTLAENKSYKGFKSENKSIRSRRNATTATLVDSEQHKPIKPLKLSISKTTTSVNSEIDTNKSPSPLKERDKPPIVLRIFKGTSQLVDQHGSSDNTGSDDGIVSSPSQTPSATSCPVYSLRRHNAPVSNNDDKNKNTILVQEQSDFCDDRLTDSKENLSSAVVTLTNSRRRRRHNSSEQETAAPPPPVKRPLRSGRRNNETASAINNEIPPTAITASNNTTTTIATGSGKIVITNLHSDHPSVYTVSRTDSEDPQDEEATTFHEKSEKNLTENQNVTRTRSTTRSIAQNNRKKRILRNNKTQEDCNDMPDISAARGDSEHESTRLNPNDGNSNSNKTKTAAELLKVLEDDSDEDNVFAKEGQNSSSLSTVNESSPTVETKRKFSDSKLPTMDIPKLKLTLNKNANNYTCRSSSEFDESATDELPTTLPIQTTRNSIVIDNCDIINDTKNSDTLQKILVEKTTKESSSNEISLSLASENSQPSSGSVVEMTDSSNNTDIAADINPALIDDGEAIDKVIEDEQQQPVAVAVIKKGSIFKHRRMAGGTIDGNKKRLALYKHKWVDEKDVSTVTTTTDHDSNKGTDDGTLTHQQLATADNDDSKMNSLDFDDSNESLPPTKVTRHAISGNQETKQVMSIHCPKKDKEFYAMVRNVKNAHEIQESGEFQEFNDDVEYILDALQDNNPISTRCLSTITLATKCTEAAFRMHVRAHGTVSKFFKALHDATKDQSLGMCTATVMFVLSEDRLNMDVDRSSLELMLNLLESDASHTNALDQCGLTGSQLTKTRDRVRQICADIQARGHAKHLNLDNITVGHLAMETLLSLTSKRAGEWFKEELRELGGLEHIIKTIVECCRHVDQTANAWSAVSLDKIRKVNRCLRVLENVTMDNEQNNVYLLEYQNGILVDTLIRMYKVCDYEIPLYPTSSNSSSLPLDKDSTGAILTECLLANLKVLINITHEYNYTNSIGSGSGSSVIGCKPGVIDCSLHVLLQLPQYIPNDQKFELTLLTLILLINLVEGCEENRKIIIEAKAPSEDESIFETKSRHAAVQALIGMFDRYEELARNAEKTTDAILDGETTEKPAKNAPQKAHEEFIEETIALLLKGAGQNMDHTLIAAHVALMIGYLITDNQQYETYVRNYLPQKNFTTMISTLEKFFSFMSLTISGGTVSNRIIKSTQMVIRRLKESDKTFSKLNDGKQITAINSTLNNCDNLQQESSIAAIITSNPSASV